MGLLLAPAAPAAADRFAPTEAVPICVADGQRLLDLPAGTPALADHCNPGCCLLHCLGHRQAPVLCPVAPRRGSPDDTTRIGVEPVIPVDRDSGDGPGSPSGGRNTLGRPLF